MENRNIILSAAGFFVLSSAVSVLCLKENAKRRVRRYAVRPMNRKRNIEGAFVTLLKDMRNTEFDNEQYCKYTRMTPNTFQYLLSLIGPLIRKRSTVCTLSPEHRLIVTIHFLAEGCSMQEIAWNYRIGKATVHVIVKETCAVLWDTLVNTEIPLPTTDSWNERANHFLNRWNMPNCIGAVDGKHVTIQAPAKSGTEYYNYKKDFSIVLLAVCDADYRFTLVDIGAQGSNHDSAVFKESGFGNALLKGKLNVPPPKYLPNTNILMPHFIVGDAAFPLHQNIMRPYPGSNLDVKSKIFNYRLSRARRTIENAFGILTQRWRILRKPIIASVEVCELITQAVVVLHNFLRNYEKNIAGNKRRYCPPGYSDYFDKDNQLHLGAWRDNAVILKSIRRIGTNNYYSQEVRNNRDNLSNYLVSTNGSVPWQNDYVLRGSFPANV